MSVHVCRYVGTLKSLQLNDILCLLINLARYKNLSYVYLDYKTYLFSFFFYFISTFIRHKHRSKRYMLHEPKISKSLVSPLFKYRLHKLGLTMNQTSLQEVTHNTLFFKYIYIYHLVKKLSLWLLYRCAYPRCY